MKHNKRFLLVAIAVLAISLLAVGVASAAVTVTNETSTDNFYYDDVGSYDWWYPTYSWDGVDESPVGFTFASNTPGVVEVPTNNSKTGSWGVKMTVKGPGTAVITATAIDKDGKALATGTYTWTLTLNKTSGITIDTGMVVNELKVDGSFYLANYVDFTPIAPATVTSYNRYSDLLWSVDNTSIARITKNGVLTGLKAGTVKVTATLKQDATITKTVEFKIVEEEDKDKVTSVAFNAESFDVKLGALGGFNAWNYLTYAPAELELYANNLFWTSSDPTVAIVYENGQVAPQKVGKATITATVKGTEVKASCVVNVVEVLVPATAASFSPATVTITDDTDLAPYLVTTPVNSDSTFIWSVDDTSKGFATVTGEGYLITKKPGTVKVTATSKDNAQVTATITVEVKAKSADKLTFSQTAFNIYENEYYYFDLDEFLIVEPKNVYPSLRWKTSDNRIAYMDGSYLVPVKPGTVTITVYDEYKPEVKAECTVTILETPVTAIAFTQAEFEVCNGFGMDLDEYIELTPADRTKDDVYYTSSDPEIASIVDDHYVSGKKVGTVTITASIRNSETDIKTATCTVKVTERALTALSFPKTEYTLKLKKETELPLGGLYGYAPVDYPIDCDTLIWTSSDDSIATVDKKGTVKATEPGTVTITVTSEKYPAVTASTTVKIEAIAVSKLTLEANVKDDPNKNTLTLEPGLYISSAFKAVIEPSNAYVKEIYYKVADPDIAEVYSESYEKPSFSVYAGRKAGTTTVTVYVDDGTTVHEAALNLTVKKQAQDLVLSAETLVLGLHKVKSENVYEALGYTFYDKSTSSSELQGVIWSSSNEKILKINKHTGKITVKKAGKVKITATAKDGSGATATCKVTVVKNLIKKITGQKVITLRVGDKYSNIYDYLKLTGTCKTPNVDFFNPVLKFKSSNDEVVSIDEDGYLAANKVGNSTITVQAQDGSKKKYTIKVNVIAAVQ